MRARLGKAVEEARIAAGYATRPLFAERAGVSLRSLIYVEQGNRSVGPKVMHPIARELPGWTPDTALEILEGGEAPLIDAEAAAKARLREDAIRRLANIKVRLPDEYAMMMQLVRSDDGIEADVDRIVAEIKARTTESSSAD